MAHTEPGVVTVTPSHPEAETYVNQHRITETTFLTHGCAVRFGRNHVFRFLDPPQDLRSTSSVTLPPPASSSEQGGQVPEGNYAYFPPGGRPVNGYPRPGKGKYTRIKFRLAILSRDLSAEDLIHELLNSVILNKVKALLGVGQCFAYI